MSLREEPHYMIASSELADWLERQGADCWWNVDGDPLLTGRLTFPCPTDELAAELRRIDRPLLLQAKKGDSQADGRRIERARLDGLVSRFYENVHTNGREYPPWANDRFFYL